MSGGSLLGADCAGARGTAKCGHMPRCRIAWAGVTSGVKVTGMKVHGYR
jgi:hypothetical protein